MTFELVTLAVVLAGLLILAIASYTVIATQVLRGDVSLPSPSDETTWSPRKPSIERSETNSTALITVQANPHRPLAYSQEPVSGSSRLVKLTVLYEQSLDDSESAILKSVDSGLSTETPAPLLTGVDDPAWFERVSNAAKAPW